MKSLSIKNLKNLREHGIVLKGNYSVTALRNPNGSIAYRFQKRIKGRNAFEGTLGYYPQMSIKDAEKEVLRLASLCERGLHPRKYDKEQEAKNSLLYMKICIDNEL